jgi:DDE domain
MLVQRRRDTRATLRLMRMLLKKQGFAPKLLVTDKLGCYGSAFRQLRLTCPHDRVLRKTIALKTPIKSCGDESARCSGSSRLDPRSGFSTSIPPSTIPSTINDISSLGRRFGSSEPKQPPGGKMRLPLHETWFDFANSLHPAHYRDKAGTMSTVWSAGIIRTRRSLCHPVRARCQALRQRPRRRCATAPAADRRARPHGLASGHLVTIGVPIRLSAL